MFNWKEFEKNKSILSLAGESYSEEWGQHYIKIRPSDLIRWIDFIKNDLGYITLVDIVCSKRTENFNFEIIYQLLNMGTHQRINLQLFCNNGEVVPSIINFYKNADWSEREQAEKFQIQFDRQMPPLMKSSCDLSLPKLRQNPNKSEPPYPEESYVWKSFEIFSKETLGKFESLICFDPNKVVASEIRIGFYYQNFENLLLEKEWYQVTELIDRINVSSAPSYSTAWIKTFEEMMRIKLPERAQAIRIVMLELARIAEHLTVMFEIAASVKENECYLFIDAREKIYELFERYSGHRQGLGVVRLGGVKADLPYGWIVEFQDVAAVLSKNLRTIHRALISRQKFRESLEGPSINAESVLALGVSGPAMRASGVNFDLRKSQPFYFYQDIDFDIPVGVHGTSYDRYLIRYEEINQSLRIITQVLDNLPLGEFINSAYDKNIFELDKFLREYDLPKNCWHYSCLEAPNGESGFFFLAKNHLTPSKIKIKSSSFYLTQALPEFLKGLREDQISSCVASLGISRLELDR